MRSLFLLAMLASSLLLLLAWPASAEDVTIYRCIAADGTLTLRDSPCAKGETQQVRSMVRPRDPVRPVAPAKAAPSPPVAPRPDVQIVYRMPARPLYECVTSDGERYTSDNGEGNPRWQPLWTVGYRGWSHRIDGGAHGGRPPYDRPGSGSPALQTGVVLPIGGTWVRDECHPLPQQEVCSRLSDRRYEIIRRYNSALQSERRQLEVEQRGIDARIDNDCGSP